MPLVAALLASFAQFYVQILVGNVVDVHTRVKITGKTKEVGAIAPHCFCLSKKGKEVL